MVSRSVTGKPARLIRSKWTQAYADSGLETLPMPFQSMVSGPVLLAGSIARRADIVPGFAGQGIGMIKARSARDVLRDIVAGAEQALAEAKRFIAGPCGACPCDRKLTEKPIRVNSPPHVRRGSRWWQASARLSWRRCSTSS